MCIEHLDPHRVAELHVGSLSLAPVDRLDAAPFGDASRAHRAVLAVGNRTGADDGTGLEVTRSRRVSDEIVEAEAHLAGVGCTDALATPLDPHGKMHSPIPPGLTELVEADGDGGEARRWLRLQKAEARLDFPPGEHPQAGIVHQH